MSGAPRETAPGARCHVCLRPLKKFKYLRRHARTVHGVPWSGELAFIRAAKAFRTTRVELERAFNLPGAPPDEVQPTTESDDTSDSDSDSDGPRRKRISRGAIDSSGFESCLENRCTATAEFERLLVQLTSCAPATAAKKAGVVFRYLSYNRTHEPDLDDVERLTTYHVAVNTVNEYQRHFSPRSVVVLTDAVRSCVHLLQFCKPLQEAFGFKPDRHRSEIVTATALWTQQRSAANKVATIRQRCRLTKQPLETWTHMFPVEAVIDYLREHGNAPGCGPRPPERRDCGEEPAATVNIPNSPHDRAVLKQRYAVTRAVAGLTLLLSGVRLCVALSMSAKDIDRATEWGEFRVVSVKKHKTKKVHGAAHIVVRPHGLRNLEDLVRATNEYFGPEEAAQRNLFGLTSVHGRASAEIFSHFNLFVRDRGYEPKFVSLRFNPARAAAESFSHLLGAPGDVVTNGMTAAQRTVADFLLHSKRVRDLYYRRQTYSALIRQWTVYSELLAVMAVLEAARGGRIKLRTHCGESNYFAL